MLEHKKWLDLDDDNSEYYYSFCASFTTFLIKNFGKDKFKEVYMKTSRQNDLASNLKAFVDVYDIDPSDLEKKWLNSVFK
jgi:hypothetical protein